MAVSEQNRKEITIWATEKAKESLSERGIIGKSISRPQSTYDALLQAEIWHFEKMAYLKIHNRESRMKK